MKPSSNASALDRLRAVTLTGLPDLKSSRDQVKLNPTLPKLKLDYKILIVGDFPRKGSYENKQHFSSKVEHYFWKTASKAGILPSSVACATLSPVVDDKSLTYRDDKALETLVDTYKPNLVLLVGKEALATTGIRQSLEDYRGSVALATTGPFAGYKFLATHAPQELIKRTYLYVLFSIDLDRAAVEGTFPEVVEQPLDFSYVHDIHDLRFRMMELYQAEAVALDIEGGVGTMSMISFATSPNKSFTVVINAIAPSHRPEFFKLLKTFCESKTPKILQNYLYDSFVLAYSYGILISNVIHDTMLGHWEVLPELPKDLGTQCSVYTKRPYYKDIRTASGRDDMDFARYCALDSAVTYEAYQQQRQLIDANPGSVAHFKHNMEQLSPALYMELRGLRYDHDTALRLAYEQRQIVAGYQQTLDVYYRDRAKIPTTLPGLNVASPLQVAKFLYQTCGYPTQHPVKNGKKVEDKVTTDRNALLALKLLYATDPVLDLLLKIRKHEKAATTLSTSGDPDGRIRCSYDVVGTKTGRYSSRKSSTGNGYNLQTVTSKHKHLFKADPGMEFWQCDLSGADAWTVAAHCSKLGDDTMWLDYSAGLKPAKIVVLMYRHGKEMNNLSREELAKLCKDVTEDGPEGWQYFACKQVQHGTNYGLGIPRLVKQMLETSYKKQEQLVVVAPADAKRLRQLYLTRYPGVESWQKWVEQQLKSKGQLTAASGNIHQFLGRRDDHSTLLAALAFEPQANTTHATSLAALRLWNDPANRRPNNSLIIAPLHQVHDALCGQHPIEHSTWARAKIRECFQNTMTIAGIPLIIPFEGATGPSWGELGPKHGGHNI